MFPEDTNPLLADKHSVEKQKRRPINLGAIGGLVFLPVLFIGAAISIPVTYVVKQIDRRKQKAFLEKMRTKDRLLEWDQFLGILAQRQGTLILEIKSSKLPGNWWWTPEDVYSVSPHPIAYDIADFIRKSPSTFHVWCYDRYADSGKGTALLVNASREQLGSIKNELESFPVVEIVSSQKN